jgi:hypothetical protein
LNFKCYKRKNEDDEESNDSNNYKNYETSNKEKETNNSNPFRSAKEQLLIDNNKSNNNNSGSNNNGYSYNPANSIELTVENLHIEILRKNLLILTMIKYTFIYVEYVECKIEFININFKILK